MFSTVPVLEVALRKGEGEVKGADKMTVPIY